tara:strand:+ start:282 stop:500 length:219 start_codon:yes stop_codon:yes gene_type:complete
MKNEDQIKTASDDELKEWASNAYYTGASCGGHKKGDRNLLYAKRYSEELAARGIQFDYKNSPDPKFNGVGSS